VNLGAGNTHTTALDELDAAGILDPGLAASNKALQMHKSCGDVCCSRTVQTCIDGTVQVLSAQHTVASHRITNWPWSLKVWNGPMGPRFQ